MQNRPVNVVERYKQRLEEQAQQQADLQKSKKGVPSAPVPPSSAGQGMPGNMPIGQQPTVYAGTSTAPMRARIAAGRGGAPTVERAGVPLSDESPVVYSDAEIWKQLTAHRKEKYSSMDLSGSKPGNAGIANASSPMGGGGMGGLGGGRAANKVVARAL